MRVPARDLVVARDLAPFEVVCRRRDARVVAVAAIVGIEAIGNWFGGHGNTRQQMVASVMAMVVNVALNWILIYGELGFAAPLARGLFVLSRAIGVLAHAWEESQSGRRIKGPIPQSILPAYRPSP